MLDLSPIIFVEPIARGFRLDVLSNAISAIRARSLRPVYVVTREDFATRELAKRIDASWTNVQFVASALNLAGASVGVLNQSGVEALLDAAACVMPDNGDADIVFLGADDYLGALAAQLPKCSARMRHARPFVLLHNTEDLVAAQFDGAPEPRIGREAIAAIDALGATLLAFDERLRGERIGNREVVLLPDPRHGPFVPAQRKRAREAYAIPARGLLVTVEIDPLLRDYVPTWQEALIQLAQAQFVYFALIGNVWALRNVPLRQLLAKISNRLVYAGPMGDLDREEQLIAATDLLLSGSATLRSADSWDPVVTLARTSVARRVRAAGLGASFDRDVRSLLLDSAEALSGFPEVGMAMIRSELDRLAQERLLHAFDRHLRAALRRRR